MENWKNIQGYEGLYQISDLGRVKSVDRMMILPTGGILHLREKIKRLLKRKRDGYWITGLSNKSKIFSAKIHRLVAQHFIPNPENKPQVNHLNGKDDNRAISLEWATSSENMQHSFNVGTHVSPACKGEKNGQSKLTLDQVKAIREKYSTSSTRKLAAEYGVSNILISKIINNKIWL